jgi:hypothetical protein
MRIAHAVSLVLILLAVLPQACQCDRVYTDRDLILENPLQSTCIFLGVIFFSTGFEIVCELMGESENHYTRTIFNSVKEEVAVLGVAQLLLLFAEYAMTSFTVVSRDWLVVIEFTSLCLFFMAVAFCITTSFIGVAMQLQSKYWRTFEWSRLEADAYHTTSERLYKFARRYFVDVITALARQRNQQVVEIPAVALHTFLSFHEKQLLKSIVDFTMQTWAGLGALIIINLCRAEIVVVLVSNDGLTQILTFINIIGVGIAIGHLIFHGVLERRLMEFLQKQVDPATAKLEEAASSCLFLGSTRWTLEVFKIVNLGILWYCAVMIVAFVNQTFVEAGYYCILIYINALIPPLLFCHNYPWTVKVVLLTSVLGKKLNYDVIDLLQNGDAEVDQEDDEEELEETSAVLRLPREERGDTEDLELELDDEPPASATVVCLHESLPKDQRPPGEPTHIIGVPPVENLAKRWKMRNPQPLFAD